MATIDSLEIQIESSAKKANREINKLIANVGQLASSLKFDTTSLEKLGKINGSNFKKLGEGLQSFANAAKNLQNVDSGNFKKLSDGLSKIASIDSSKLEALGKIDGNSFRRLGEGVKSLSSGLQNLQGVKKSDFNRLALGIERLASIQPGNMESVGNALRPLADGIDILSNAKFDNKNLQNLINSLTRLANANTGSLANIDFSTLGNSINGLAQTLSKAEEVKQNTISMTNAIAKLASAGNNANITAGALPQLGTRIKEFMQTMSGAAKLESDTISFTQALAQLASAGKRAEATASALPALGDSLKNVFDVMSRVPTISQNTISFTQALAQLASAGGRTGNVAGNLSGTINKLSSSMGGLKGIVGKTATSLKSLGRQLLSSVGIYLGIYGAIRGIKNAIDISSDLTEVQNVVDVTFQDMAYKVEDFAQTSIEQFGMSELALKQYSSRFQAMGAAMGIDSSLISQANDNLSRLTNGYISASDSMSDVSINLTKLTADMASFYNAEQDVVAEDLAAIFTGQTRPLRDYGLDLTQATLQEWALKQGIDADIQSMSQAEKTMLRYQYVMANTGAAQGDFARTAGTWANQIRILRQNFEQLAAVIGTSFINALKPLVKALNTAMSHIIAFAKTVSNALGKIFGWTFEEGGGVSDAFGDAAESSEDIADSTGKAEKNIKKIRAGLRAFDELKVINMPDDNDGAGKGAGDGIGGAAGGAIGGNWIQGDSLLKQYESEIDTIYKLGEYIGKTLADAMNSIDWNNIYEKARNFGKGLADFLNGLISPDLFGAIGRTIAGALNTAVYSALSFGETFDWEDFGVSIATGINDFFEDFDFVSLAKTINVWIKGALKSASSLLKKTDFKKIGKKIGEFLSNLDLLGALKGLADVVWEAIKGAFDLLTKIFSSAPLEASLLTVISFLKFTKVGQIFSGNLLNTLKTSVSNVLSTFSTYFKGGIAGAVGTAVVAFAEFSIVSDSLENLTLGTGDFITEIGKIAGAVGIASVAMSAALGFPAGVIAASITGLVGAIKGINDAFNEIKAESAMESVGNALKSPGGIPISEITESYQNMVSSISSGFDAINQKAEELETTKIHAKETSDSIDLIKFSLENGSITAQEKIPELNELFNELLVDSKSIFEQEYDIIMTGISGSLGQAMIDAGYSIEQIIGQMDSLKTGHQQAIDEMERKNKELEQSYENGEISQEQYSASILENLQKLGEITGKTDEYSDAIDKVSQAVGGVDFSKIINEDNTVNTGLLAEEFERLSGAADEAKNSIYASSENLTSSLKDYESEAIRVGNSEAADAVSTMISKEAENVEKAVESIDSEIVKYGDAIQVGLLEKIPDVIDNALEDYQNQSFWYKLLHSEEEHVQAALDEYQKSVIEPTSSELEKMYSDMGVEGSAWASDAMSDMMNGLYKDTVTYSAAGIPKTKKAIRSDWEEILSGALSEATKAIDAGSYGDNIGKSISDGINKSKKNPINAIMEVMEDMGLAVHDGYWEFGSPSRKAMEYGRWITGGIDEGISSGFLQTKSTIGTYMQSMVNSFSGIGGTFSGIGVSVMQGLQNGVSSMEGSLYSRLNNIANNIVGTISRALDIHSPSRVMFKLGDYTMSGFQEGIESLYKPILSSEETFIRDFQIASEPNIRDVYGDYQYQNMPYTMQYGTLEQLQRSYNQSNAETNALLMRQNELLEKILAKPNLNNSDIFNAAQTVYKGEATRRYGDSMAFDPVWG